MSEMYSINDIAQMSGLTTRTIRNYIKQGTLKGEKINGMWQFSSEAFLAFLDSKDAKTSINAKRNAIVYDFIADNKRPAQKVCVILDDFMDEAVAQKTLQAACALADACSDTDDTLRFSLEKSQQNIRIFLSGSLEMVYQFLKEYRAFLS